MPLLFRYYQSLIYSIMCKRAELKGDIEKQRYYYNLLVKEDSDVALVRVFECFLEATPQKILQITIFLISGEDLRGKVCTFFNFKKLYKKISECFVMTK